MSLTRIRTNTQALRAYRQLRETSQDLALRQQRLTTGKRINRAEDDSAGYFIAERLESKTRAQAQALANIGDARSMLTVAEGGLNTQMDLLQSINEKLTQAASDTMGRRERAALHRSVQRGLSEVEEIAAETDFNGKKLLDGSAGAMSLQVGASSGEQFKTELGGSTLEELGLEKSFEAGSTDFSEGFVPFIETSGYDEAAYREGQTYRIEVNGVTHYRDADGEPLQKWKGGLSTYNEDGIEYGGYGIKYRDPDTDLKVMNGLDGAEVDFSEANWQDFWKGDPVADADSTSTNGKGVTSYKQRPADGEVEMFVHIGGKTLDVSSAERAGEAVERLEGAIETVSEKLSQVGTAQKRLSFKAENLSTAMNNYEAARSRIIDADYAREQMQITKQQILRQAGQAALTQATRAPRSMLQLLGGGGSPTGGLLDLSG